MNIDKLPEPLDPSGVKNTAASIANWTLKVILPTLNEVIQNQRKIIKAIREDDPVRDGTPGKGTFDQPSQPGGDGGDTDPDDIFPSNGTPEVDTPTDENQPSSQELAELGELLQELDSRAAQNLGDAGLADPQALREISDEELREIDYVADEALKKIRNVFSYDGDSE